MSHERIYGLQHPSTLGVKGKKRYAMVVDLDRCNGCMACSVACSTEFNKPLGIYRTWVKVVDHGTFPRVKRPAARRQRRRPAPPPGQSGARRRCTCPTP